MEKNNQTISILNFEKLGKILKIPENNTEDIFQPITSLDLIILQHAINNNNMQLIIYDLSEKFKINSLKINQQNYIYETLKNNTIENLKESYPEERLKNLLKK